MSHIHIPDGVLPLWLIGLGWLATAIMLYLGIRSLRRADRVRVVPHIGVMAALVVAAMSMEIVPIAYHVNLTVLAGIILGPAASMVAAFVVNLVLALFGHGGVTVIGLNTVVIGAEMVGGALIFRAVSRALPARPGLSAGLATVLTLFLSTTLMIGIVGLSRVNPANARDLGALSPRTLSFSNPLKGGLFANRIVTPEQEAAHHKAPLSLARFAVAVYILGAIGWTIESLLVGYMVAFIARVRPGLLRSPLLARMGWT